MNTEPAEKSHGPTLAALSQGIEMTTEYIVICQQIVGGNGRPFTTVYGCDHERFATREQAVSHGFKVRASDDFNVATVEDGCLTGFFWMDKDMSDPQEMCEIAAQLGLSRKRSGAAKNKTAKSR